MAAASTAGITCFRTEHEKDDSCQTLLC